MVRPNHIDHKSSDSLSRGIPQAACCYLRHQPWRRSKLRLLGSSDTMTHSLIFFFSPFFTFLSFFSFPRCLLSFGMPSPQTLPRAKATRISWPSASGAPCRDRQVVDLVLVSHRPSSLAPPDWDRASQPLIISTVASNKKSVKSLANQLYII